MKLIFHIGSHKTGTTSLQDFLSSVSPTLSAAGVAYPRPKADIPMHYALLSGLVPEADLPRIARFSGTEQRRKFRKKRALAALRKIVAAGKHDTILLSSEEFFTPMAEEGLAHLKAELTAIGIQSFHFVAYLRQPSAFYRSWLQQTLKASYVPPLMTPPPYERIFAPYLQVFGDQALQLRLYPEVWPEGDDIIRDFCREVLSMDGLQAQAVAKSQLNQSLSAESIALMQSYRFAFLRSQEDRFTADSRSLGAVLSRLEKEFATTKIRLHETVAQQIDADAAPLLWLRDTLSFQFPALAYERLETKRSDEVKAPLDLRELITIHEDMYRKLAERLGRSSWIRNARLESRLVAGLDAASHRRRYWLDEQAARGYCPPAFAGVSS
ncbi:hypothetical protein [Celeribacter sp. ULVN23_4]